ncbi:MAG: hypothetical protein IJO43_02740 [Bacilli bacterium]|nr:hypothetical protein [Bacilli bacterium]
MGKEQRFLVVKNKDSKDIKYFEYDKISGYNIKPNPKLKFQDAINVNRMILINPSLIEKMVDKKIKRKFDYLINLLSVVYENDDETGEGLRLALNEAEKFRMELINKYKQYVKEEKMELMLKKIAILEDELYLRMQYIMNREYYMEPEEKKEGKSR